MVNCHTHDCSFSGYQNILINLEGVSNDAHLAPRLLIIDTIRVTCIFSLNSFINMVAPDNLVDSSMDRAESKGDTDDQAASIANGNEVQSANDQITNKKPADSSRQPSYVALACCISGYTTLHYDSKQRQGLRSPRPLSPIRPPTSLNNGNQNTTFKSDCGNFLSPQQQQELNCKMATEGKGIEVLNGCQDLSSPRHLSRMSITSESRRNFTSSMISETYTSYSSTSTSHYSSYSSSTTSNTTPGKTEYLNGSRLIPAAKAPTQISPSSFIVQRVERLYGPGALAQGFYSPRRITSVSKDTKGSTPDGSGDKVDDSLPVLKLLRPEFRAQLTVASRKSKSPESKLSSLVSVQENSIENNSVPKAQTDTVDAAAVIEKTKQLHIEEVKDGNYFLKLLNNEVSELEKLAEKADKELESCESEEGAGMLRAVSGKARLLVAEKLNQFRGLCYKNLKQTDDEDFPTTNEDLAGFWDMVLIQVKAVIAQFEEIEEMKNNNWKQVTPKPKIDNTPKPTGAQRKLVPRKLCPEPKVSAASKARDEARRKLIEEKRKAMKNMKKEDETVIIV